jgi:hypothetical protein
MPPERIAELRRLLELENSVTLSAKEFSWLLDIHEQMKAALRGLFETHVAIDPPEKGPCMSRRNSRARPNRRIRGLSFPKRPKSRERSAEMARRLSEIKEATHGRDL